jgi:hypothetical protein
MVMTTRTAACFCGDFSLTLEGEPMLVSSCCCTRCQRRTGSFFGVTAYFDPAQVTGRTGAEQTFQRDAAGATIHRCARCGTMLWWASDDWGADIIGVAGGCFADPTLPSPQRMVFTATKHPYVQPPPGVPTYEDGPPE